MENTIDASLEAVDFIDIKTINNYAQIIQPAAEQTDETHTIAVNDPTTTPPADTGAGNDDNKSETESGGGAFSVWLILGLMFFLTTALTREKSVRRLQV